MPPTRLWRRGITLTNRGTLLGERRAATTITSSLPSVVRHMSAAPSAAHNGDSISSGVIVAGSAITTPLQQQAKLDLLKYASSYQAKAEASRSSSIALIRNRQKAASSMMTSESDDQTAAAPNVRRWLRDGYESCLHLPPLRSHHLLTHYVGVFKMKDPQWRSLLSLPVGHPVGTEVKARHCHVALRHLVQKGHALYIIQHSRHTVFHPRGVSERAHIVCTLGKKNEHLLTFIKHEGPIDGRFPDGPRGIVAYSEVAGVAQPFRRRWMSVERGRRVGALQATVGAVDWQMCAPEEVGRDAHAEVMLVSPHRASDFGNASRVAAAEDGLGGGFGSGLSTIGIVSSFNVADHPYQFVTDFEAPSHCAMDALHQGAYLLARGNGLITRVENQHPVNAVVPKAPRGPAAQRSSSTKRRRGTVEAPPVTPPTAAAAVAAASSSPPSEAISTGERLYALGWGSYTPHPYLGLEVDLPFKVQLSPPQLHRDASACDSVGIVGHPPCAPVSTTPFFQTEYSIHQGCPEYLYDQGPVFRPQRWWHQRDLRPYTGHAYWIRDGILDGYLTELNRARDQGFADRVANPFEDDTRGLVAHPVSAGISPMRDARRSTPGPSSVNSVAETAGASFSSVDKESGKQQDSIGGSAASLKKQLLRTLERGVTPLESTAVKRKARSDLAMLQKQKQKAPLGDAKR